MLLKLLVFEALVCYLTNVFATSDDLVVSLPNGSIRGRTLLSQKGAPFYAFQQIPYAAPPVGHLRFKEPIPPKNWDGILDATANTKICHQTRITNDTREDEDCLYLNVYTPVNPDKKTETPLAVLAYIYGGGFGSGDGTYESYGPEFWMDYGIIIVTFNHRLGPLGFLTAEDRVIPANNGLKDQNTALRWIKNNIDRFGGDPNKVTLSGQSSGGASTSFQVLSEKGKGLIRAAILQSGNSLNFYVINNKARETAYLFANLIDEKITPEVSSLELLKFLQNLPVSTIKNTVLPSSEFSIGAEIPWSAAFEDKNHKESFLVDYMHESLKEGNFNKIPMLIGFNSEEDIGSPVDFDAFKAQLIRFDNNFTYFVNPHYNIDPSNVTAAGSAFRKIYTDGLFQDDIGNSVRFMSDARMTTSSARHAVLQSKYVPVYFYQFSYSGALGGIHKYFPGVGGLVGHTDELKYMWRTARNEDLTKYPQSDLLAQARLLTLWSNFVKYLNPTPKKEQLFNDVLWPTMTEDNFVYLNISDTLQIEKDPKEYKKWKNIIDTYGNPPFQTY